MYIWELPDWPRFHWKQDRLAKLLATVHLHRGRLLGRLESLGLGLKNEALLRTLTDEVLKSSEIEGELLDVAQVRSSIVRRLGIDVDALAPADRRVEGVVEMTLDATQEFDRPLDVERLFAWHAALFSTGESGVAKIRVGAWRDDRGGPMQDVSGPTGSERVRYQAPPAARIVAEMSTFLDWFNREDEADPILRAGLAHFWFVTIHPFDDGNGRIARAIADMALARSEGTKQRFYSMSAQIGRERNTYYDTLEDVQKGSMDITAWLAWFVDRLGRAIDGAKHTLSSVIAKAKFWATHAGAALNERQVKVLNQLLDGFKGNLTSSKWAKLAECSQDTAHRDIVELLGRGIMKKNPAGGRSTSYELIRA